MGYTSVDFDLWATIDGVHVNLVQFACSYEMNRIPSCTAILPVGYTALPPHIASAAHTAAGLKTPLQVPMVVYATSTLKATSGPAIWPAGTYVLFCGWCTGVGYRRTHSGYAMTVEGTHWLSALSFSSTLSGTSHPNNPAHFTFNSVINLNAAGGNLGHFVARTAAQDIINSANITANLWGDAVKPWFLELAGKDRLQIPEFAGKGNDGVNQEATAALNLIGGELPFDGHGADGDAAAGAIADDIAVTTLTPSNASNTLHGMANMTFWDKLVGELSSKYFFKLIPFPDRAELVPFIPGFAPQGGVWNPNGEAATIMARDISQQDMNAHLPRALRAVGFYAGHGSRAGGNLIPDDAVNDDTIGGMYIGRDNGMVMLKRAPQYLSNYVLPFVFAADALGINDVRGNAFNHPGDGAPNAAAQDPKAGKEDAVTLLNELAHAMYVYELLKNRWGDITGPVRFDICPGSTISFEGTDGQGQPPGAGELRYGEVIRVSHYFDAQHQKCYTGFRMAHVRTGDEHGDPDYTIDQHPLYTNSWHGDYQMTIGQGCP